MRAFGVVMLLFALAAIAFVAVETSQTAVDAEVAISLDAEMPLAVAAEYAQTDLGLAIAYDSTLEGIERASEVSVLKLPQGADAICLYDSQDMNRTSIEARRHEVAVLAVGDSPRAAPAASKVYNIAETHPLSSMARPSI